MSGEPTLQYLIEVQTHFGLPGPALVEKDFYVVRALAAIAALDTAPLRLVFGGGTALSRAHRLIRRMSEDIDLRIVAETPARGALRRLRDQVTAALLEAGFKFDPGDEAYRRSRNASRYTTYRLPYEPAAEGQGALRPAIQIETALWPLRRPAVERPVISFVAEAEAQAQPPEIAGIACVSITETAADKLVALTRRAGAEFAGVDEPDPALVRHLYDLHALRRNYDAAEVADLAREVMRADADAYGNRFPGYRDDPVRETLRAVARLASDPDCRARYERFHRLMVYGPAVEFGDCIRVLRELAGRLGGRSGLKRPARPGWSRSRQDPAETRNRSSGRNSAPRSVDFGPQETSDPMTGYAAATAGRDAGFTRTIWPEVTKTRRPSGAPAAVR